MAYVWQPGDQITAERLNSMQMNLGAHREASPIDHPDLSIPQEKLSFGVWEKIRDLKLVSGCAEVFLSGLDISLDRMYMLDIDTCCNTDWADYVVLINNDTSYPHYYTQLLEASGSAVSASRNNNPTFCFMTGAYPLSARFTFFPGVGAPPRWIFDLIRNTSDGPCRTSGCTHYYTAANLTHIILSGGRANSFKTGTHIALYRMSPKHGSSSFP